MRRFALLASTLFAAVTAQAQIYQWQDENNKTIISDRPPTGNVRQQKKIAAEAPAAGAEAGKTMADREMEFRKRQKESLESADKAEKEKLVASQKQEDCQAARRALQILESGERIASRDSKGERYYLDDAQREQEINRARQAVGNCK